MKCRVCAAGFMLMGNKCVEAETTTPRTTATTTSTTVLDCSFAKSFNKKKGWGGRVSGACINGFMKVKENCVGQEKGYVKMCVDSLCASHNNFGRCTEGKCKHNAHFNEEESICVCDGSLTSTKGEEGWECQQVKIEPENL